jgi:MFS transporter, DHA1 family, multidrug resistance protein
MMAYVADITTEKERGKGMGLLGACMSLGFVIGPGIGGFLLAEIGIRVPFYTSTVIAAVATILSLLFLPETLSVMHGSKLVHPHVKKKALPSK